MWKERMDIHKPRMDPGRNAEVGKAQKLVSGGTSVALPAPANSLEVVLPY